MATPYAYPAQVILEFSACSRTAPAHHSTRDAGFRLRTPGPVKNPRREPRGGVFSIGRDPNHLANAANSVSAQRQT